MSFYTTIILLQSLLILAWVFYVKSKHNEIPEFDAWLKRMMKHNPNLRLEDAFDEYIHKYDVMVLQDQNETEGRAIARTKLQLIENYNLDSFFQERESFNGYKMSLQQIIKN